MSTKEISIKSFNKIATLIDERYPDRTENPSHFVDDAREYLRGAVYSNIVNGDFENGHPAELPETTDELQARLKLANRDLFDQARVDGAFSSNDEEANAQSEINSIIGEIMELAAE